MGGKKKSSSNKKSIPNEMTILHQNAEDKERFVNLLHVYTIYKQKFRRLNKEEFKKLICGKGKNNRKAAFELCKELMKAKQIPYEVDFKKNVGFLSLPRLMPLIALLAERADHKLKPSLVTELIFTYTPQRFQDKFAYLMVYGFWFLGRVIADSLSSKEQVSRGNMFNFSNGDLGFWWAGVKILDWICYLKKVEKYTGRDCRAFVMDNPPQYQFYSSRAIINMNNHPVYFLSHADWVNFSSTVDTIRHRKISTPAPVEEVPVHNSSISEELSSSQKKLSSSLCSINLSCSDISDLTYQYSINSLGSRDSLD